jgi:putative Mg2+ transporter-C (MgtC) family protein
MFLTQDDLLKLLIAMLIGGLIGAEREFRDKAAGFRTIIFICTGATLFTIFSQKLGGAEDAARIAAQIVSGVGFLGAGVILRDGGRVIGLTTASTVWLAAALGMGIGSGEYVFTATATGAVLFVLWIFPKFEEWIDNIREERTYEVVCAISAEKFAQLEKTFQECGLRVRTHRQVKSGTQMTCTWETRGSPKNHDRLMKILFADGEVKEFRF